MEQKNEDFLLLTVKINQEKILTMEMGKKKSKSEQLSFRRSAQNGHQILQ